MRTLNKRSLPAKNSGQRQFQLNFVAQLEQEISKKKLFEMKQKQKNVERIPLLQKVIKFFIVLSSHWRVLNGFDEH